jgi:hypothetical protein
VRELKVDSVLNLGEDEYLFGEGPLKIRVEQVERGFIQAHGCTWKKVIGKEIRWDGREMGREVYVKVHWSNERRRP